MKLPDNIQRLADEDAMRCACGEEWRPFPGRPVRGKHPPMAEHAKQQIHDGMLTWIERHRGCGAGMLT